MARKKVSPQKFQQLAEQANDFYNQSRVSFDHARDRWKHGLECAAKCGTALLEIKRSLSWGKFKKWTKDNFDGRSYNTASDYMRVAKAFKNKDPRLEEAKKAGKELSSINAVKEILRKPRVKENDIGNDDGDSVAPTEADMASCLRQCIGKKFTGTLRNLCMEELKVCGEDMDVFGECWRSFYNTLYKIVCQKYEFDLNEYFLENGKLKIKRTLIKTRSDYVKEGEISARKDMEFPNKTQRIGAAERTKALENIVSLRTLLALNKNRMTEQRRKKIERRLREFKEVV